MALTSSLPLMSDETVAEIDALRSEVERLRALVGPNEASYQDLLDDVEAAREAAKTAELAAGEARGELHEVRIDLHRARQDQIHVQKAVLAPAIRVRNWLRRLRGR